MADFCHDRYFAGSTVDRKFSDDLFNSAIHGPTDPFEARNKNLPHVMFLTANGLTALNESIYRSELLAILAVMITQLKKPSLQGHRVIPVCVLLNPLPLSFSLRFILCCSSDQDLGIIFRS
jgi:hypothetical protein